MFEGSFVSIQNSNVAVFGELASSAPLMSASKMVEIPGCPKGWTIQQSDAQQAYTQSELHCTGTRIFLPSGQCLRGWNTKYRNLVVKRRLGLYGHPVSGACWVRHCTEQLRSVGFEPVMNCESMFRNKGLRVILSVYVDDFKMAGPVDNMKKAWPTIRGIISMDGPRNLGKCLGCGHESLGSVSNGITKASVGHVPLLSSQPTPSAQRRTRRLRA